MTPGMSTGDTTIDVVVNRDGLDDGYYSGTLSVTSNGGNKAVPIVMLVGDIIAVEKTTWGLVKALYADD